MAITKTLTTDEAGRKPKLTAEEIILEQRRQTADYIIKQIEEQEKLPPWERGFVFDIKGQYNPISNVQYSGANIMHLTAAALKNGWQDPRWITIPQMKAENERLEGNGFPRAYKLRKGSKSTILEFHQEVYRDETTGKIMPTNRTSDNTSSSDKRDDERNTWWVHKYYKVFNAEQFELFPELEQTQEVIKEFPEEVRNKFIENIIQNSEAQIYHDQVAENYYLPLADEIHLVPPEHWSSIDHYYSTALHEIAHSTGHPMRLDREMMNNKGTQRYAREELVAEFTSAILHNSYNLERSKEFRDNNAAYLKSWANALRKDPNVFVIAIRNAEKAAKYIEDHMLDQELKAELLASLEATNTQVETPTIESVNTIETVFEPREETLMVAEEKVGLEQVRIASLKDVDNLTTSQKFDILNECIGIELVTANGKPIQLGEFLYPSESKGVTANEHTFQTTTKDGNEPIIYAGREFVEFFQNLTKEQFNRRMDGSDLKLSVRWYVKPLEEIHLRKPLQEYPVTLTTSPELNHKQEVKTDYLDRFKALARWYESEFDEDTLSAYVKMATDLQDEGIFAKAVDFTEMVTEENHSLVANALLVDAMVRGRGYTDLRDMPVDIDVDGRKVRGMVKTAYKSLAEGEDIRVALSPWKAMEGYYTDEPWLFTNIKLTDIPMDKLLKDEYRFKKMQQAYYFDRIHQLAQKGYVDLNVFSPTIQKEIVEARQYTEEIIKKYNEYINSGKRLEYNPSLSKALAIQSENELISKMIDSLPQQQVMNMVSEIKEPDMSMVMTDDLANHTSIVKMPASIEEVNQLTTQEKQAILERALGVRIEFMEASSSTIPDPLDSTKELMGSYLGGGTTVFGNAVSKAAGGHFYAIDYGDEQRHVLYSGKELNQLINDLQKEDIIRNQFGTGGYTKTYLEYYLRPVNELNSEKPLTDYLVVTDPNNYRNTLRYDMGDGDFHQSHNVIDYLEYLASKESLPIHKDAKIYLAIAKDLEKEQVLTKPSFENNTEVLFKSMAIVSLQNQESMKGRYRWDVANELESSIIELQSSKSVMDIIKDNYLPTALTSPTMEYTDILSSSHIPNGPNSGLYEAVIDATHLSQAHDLMNKGYFKLEDLPKKLQSDIVNAPKIASKLNEYYRASQKNEEKVYDNHRFTAKQSAQFMFDTIPNATVSHEREDALKPPDIKLGLKHMVTPEIKTLDDIDTLTLRQKVNVLRKGVGVEIAYTEGSSLNHESYHNQLDYSLGGGTIVFGKELGEHTGGHPYSVDMKTPIVYRGEQANQLLNDLSNEDALQQMLCVGCAKTEINYYITPVAQLNDRVTSLDDPKRLLYQDQQNIGDGVDYTRERSNLGLALDKAADRQPDNFDLQVYAKIAKDLEKEAILEKPRLPLDNPMFVKSVALAVSRQEIDVDNAIGWAVREHPNVVTDVENFKDPTKILEDINIPSLASGYRPLNDELLDHTPKEIGYPIDHVYETLKQASQQKLAEVLVKKGYIPEHSLHDDACKGLEGAEYFSNRLYSKYQKHVEGNQDALDSGYALDNKHYLIGDYLASEFKKVKTIDLRREQERQASLSAAPVATMLSKEAYTYTLPDEAFKEKSKNLPKGTSYGLYDPPYVPTTKSKDKVETQTTQNINSRRERRQVEKTR